ncbi:GpE family phage tail protein [Mesorhizobium sp. M0204]
MDLSELVMWRTRAAERVKAKT